MASGFFAILDDVAILLDDAAVMSKVAAKKTAGILGDDLAVNAEKATGFSASRELPVIWEITKGSFINKLIILPLAFLLSAIAPFLIVPILLFGGAYLCYEGAEKVVEWIISNEKPVVAAQQSQDSAALLAHEHVKIRSAIRTDFILSIEIVIIALGTVLEKSLGIQVLVVSFVALLATAGVYGLVALLVRMDDAGYQLIQLAVAYRGFMRRISLAAGKSLVVSLPYVIRLLGIVGTIAMLLVGGSMYLHNLKWVHHLFDFLPLLLSEFVVGLIVGFAMVVLVKLFSRLNKGRVK